MSVLYNEIDPNAAAWLRELIKQGHIADGVVDERSIEDIRPEELSGFTQCHFFAGIGGWPYTLRCAGWPDDRPLWTGSCPCQPFSAAGKGGGFADERHLWPAFHWLIEQCRPAVVLGEQVASKDGLAWLDLVRADLEGSGYTSGAVDTCAAGFGAPHIRQRLYWMAYANGDDEGGRRVFGPGEGHIESAGAARERSSGLRPVVGLAHHHNDGLQGRPEQAVLGTRRWGEGAAARRIGIPRPVRLADDDHGRRQGREIQPDGAERHAEHGGAAHRMGDGGRPGPTNGLWRDADWLFCRDGKWRPVEPGTFPLAHGAAARVGRLRGYGNAINVAQAAGFVEAALDVLGGRRLLLESEIATDDSMQGVFS